MKLDRLFAGLEARLRHRLHRAANRQEDADPVAVRASLAGVRALNLVDRLIGFRGRHASTVDIPAGERRPTPAPTRRPELGGLDPGPMDASERARLRERYRAWERRLLAEGETIGDPHHASGGREISASALSELEPLHREWTTLLDAVAARTGQTR
jgi:hypothetical protein